MSFSKGQKDSYAVNRSGLSLLIDRSQNKNSVSSVNNVPSKIEIFDWLFYYETIVGAKSSRLRPEMSNLQRISHMHLQKKKKT